MIEGTVPLGPFIQLGKMWRDLFRERYGQGDYIPSTPIRTDPAPGWNPDAAGPSLREMLDALYAPPMPAPAPPATPTPLAPAPIVPTPSTPPFQGPLPQPTPPTVPPPTQPPTTAPPAPQRPDLPIPSGDPDRGVGWANILSVILRRLPGAARWGDLYRRGVEDALILATESARTAADILRERQARDRARRGSILRVPRTVGNLPDVIVRTAPRTRPRVLELPPELPMPDVRIDPIRVPVPEVPSLPSPAPAPPAPATRPATPVLPFLVPFIPTPRPSTRTPPRVDPFAPFAPPEYSPAPTPPRTSSPTPQSPDLGLTPRDVPDVSFDPRSFAPPQQPPTRSRDCQCSERKPRRKKGCTNPVVSRRKREKDGRILITTTRELKCPSSRKS